MADEWFYTQQGQQQGPVSAGQLKQLAVSGRLLPSDLVWKEGMANWVPASTARGLFPQSPASGAMAPPSGRTARSGGVPTTGRTPRAGSAPASERTPRAGSAPASERTPRAGGAPVSGRIGVPGGGPVSGRMRSGPIHVTPIDEDDEDYEDEPLETAPRRAAPGLSTGVWVAIIGGSAAVLVLVLVVVLILVLSSGGRNSYSTPIIQPWQRYSQQVHFEAGKAVEINVTSDQNSDMDLEVYDAQNHHVASDKSFGPNSHVRFIPIQSGNYRLDIVNRSAIANRSHVTYRQ